MSAKLDKHKIAHACSFKTAVVLCLLSPRAAQLLSLLRLLSAQYSVLSYSVCSGYLLKYSRSRLWWALASRKFLLEGQEKPSLYSVWLVMPFLDSVCLLTSCWLNQVDKLNWSIAKGSNNQSDMICVKVTISWWFTFVIYHYQLNCTFFSEFPLL